MANRNVQRSFRNSFASGIIKIADGLIQVLSFGLLYSSFDMAHTEWKIRRSFKKAKAKRLTKG